MSFSVKASEKCQLLWIWGHCWVWSLSNCCFNCKVGSLRRAGSASKTSSEQELALILKVANYKSRVRIRIKIESITKKQKPSSNNYRGSANDMILLKIKQCGLSQEWISSCDIGSWKKRHSSQPLEAVKKKQDENSSNSSSISDAESGYDSNPAWSVVARNDKSRSRIKSWLQSE